MSKKTSFEALTSDFLLKTLAQTFSMLLVACTGFWQVCLHACASAIMLKVIVIVVG